MAVTLVINEFIDMKIHKSIRLVDVRSEKEFIYGHIPGSFNIPLLNNEERVIIGTLYKKEGREVAVKKGFELIGPRFSKIIADAEQVAPEKKIMLYCWRGGMRSNIVAWLLNMAGFQVFLLKGGYKIYRNWALEQFESKKNILVIGGKTGSGKTDLLKSLSLLGEQVIDLEGLANHKGSAFGGMGQQPQFTNEHFENLLAMQWYQTSKEGILWLENESRSVGSNIIPLGIFNQLRDAPVWEIVLDKKIRLKRILEEYGKFPLEELNINTSKLAKRLGGLKLREALKYLAENDMSGWAGVLLDYYDKTYEYSNNLRDKKKEKIINLDHDRMSENAKKVIALYTSAQPFVNLPLLKSK